MSRRLLVAAIVTASALVGPAVAAAVTYAPVDQPGPALDVPAPVLAASLHCTANLPGAARDPVLLIPGTTVDPPESFSWNYEKALTVLGIPFCDVTVPNHTDGDIQVAAEYVVSAVRYMHASSHHQVVMFGWSQGASTLPRWALRFWPDIRPQVASLVGLAPLNNRGAIVANGACAIGSCVPAAWQQAVGARFMDALNSRQQVFPGIAYTSIFTRTDDVVSPDVDGSLSRMPGPNVLTVATQDICPQDLSEHLTIISSPAAYAVAIDAIEHPGKPADLSRVHASAPCLPGTMPGVDPTDFLAEEAHIIADVGPRLLEGQVSTEPPLKCYVTSSCPPVAQPRAQRRRATARRRTSHHRRPHRRRGG